MSNTMNLHKYLNAPEKLTTLGNQFIYLIEKINFGYSLKNIGVPQNKTYLLQLIEKIEMIIKRMRWIVLCNSKKETNNIKNRMIRTQIFNDTKASKGICI